MLYLFVGEYLLFRIKENIPIKYIVEKQMQSKEECYYGRALFDDNSSLYKFEALQYKKPKILILGQSIVMNYRDFFFHPYEKDFYNAGFMARTLADVVYFADLIEKGTVVKPEFMVLGIDYGYISGNNFLDQSKWLTVLPADEVFEEKDHLRAIQSVLFDEGVVTVPDVDYGYGKKGMVGIGYRKDGSFSYKWETMNLVNDSIHNEGPLLGYFKNKQKRFKKDAYVDTTKVRLLLESLHKFRNMGIEILIYIPPFSDEFFDGIMENENFRLFWAQYMDFVNALEKDHFDIIKFTTPSGMGLTKYSMNNADHPGDVMVAKQFYSYCISSSRKNKFIDKIDTVYLKKAIDAPQTNCLSFMRDRWN